MSPLYVDAANGIGADALENIVKYIPEDKLKINSLNINTADPAILNFKCGADFVKMNQKAPVGLNLVPGERYASFDGDADRIVFYYVKEDGTFALLDGDKIATLAASAIQEFAREADIKVLNEKGEEESLHVGLVQTAYANGNSTKYVKEELVSSLSFWLLDLKDNIPSHLLSMIYALIESSCGIH